MTYRSTRRQFVAGAGAAAAAAMALGSRTSTDGSAASAPAVEGDADLVVFNGSVATMDPAHPRVGRRRSPRRFAGRIDRTS
jgi:hypothetical protein